jgi:uracil phosphoribosyltransferase
VERAQVIIVDHPLLKRDLTVLRDRSTPPGTFRSTLADAASILAYESMRTLPVENTTVHTPLMETDGHRLAREVVVVPVLRAGLGMVDGFVRFVPEARIGHLGMYRDEQTHRPVDYYASIPPQVREADVYLIDPMLATGGSAAGALEHLKRRGARRLTFVCLVAAPEGIARLHEYHPDVPIVTASVDEGLNENAFIRPGLGDAGDRTFGT